MDNTLVLHDHSSLALWKQSLLSTFWTRNLPAVQVQLQHYSPAQNQNHTALALGLQKACGCASSGFFMSLTIAMMLVTFFLSGNHFSDITLQHALLLTGSTVLAGLCGKLLGLLWARWRLLRLAARLCNETILEQGHKLKTSI